MITNDTLEHFYCDFNIGLLFIILLVIISLCSVIISLMRITQNRLCFMKEHKYDVSVIDAFVEAYAT